MSGTRWFAATFSAALVHAATRMACPLGVEFGSDEARAAWYAVTDANDPTYTGVYSIRVLCRKGGATVPRVWSELFRPSGIYDFPGHGRLDKATCRRCADLFTALYLPSLPGMDRECAACGKTLPGNYFTTDLRTCDALSRTCTPCRDEQRRDREWERRYGFPRPKGTGPIVLLP